MLPDDLEERAAVFSSCQSYRYWLRRRLSMWGVPVAFIMLNPSTADHERNDPTVQRCETYARAWGASDLIVLNIFALRSTDPAGLKTVADPIGPLNAEAFHRGVAFCQAHGGWGVAAWGEQGKFCNRNLVVRNYLRRCDLPLYCLGVTKAGEPRHPLYLRRDLKPKIWDI